MTNSIYDLPLRQVLSAVSAGNTTVRALAETLLERAEDREEELQAFAHLDPNALRATADALDARGRGMRGLLFAAKDNIDTHDMPTAYGSAIHAGARPVRDAACVAELRALGALLVGKTVSTEFAHRHPGPTTNPHDATRTPGGSSSGSAAAVGADLVPVAFGSQTTGSVIRPAAYCGVIGYKPTFGEVNPSGMLANTPSFDTVGLFCRDLDDLVVMRHALLADDGHELEAPDIQGLHIAVCRTPWWDQADADARRETEVAADALARAGANVQDYAHDNLLTALEPVNRVISGFEFARTMAHERLYAPDRLSPILRDGRMADGLEATYEEYRAARLELDALRVKHDAMMEDVDVILTLPAPGEAPVGLDATGPATFNMPWTTLHNPTVTVPFARGDHGMPLGLQLVAARHADRRLLACALAVSRTLG